MTRPNNSKNKVYNIIVSNPIVFWGVFLLCISQELLSMLVPFMIFIIIFDSGVECGSGLCVDILFKVVMIQSIYFILSMIVEMTLVQFYYPRCYYPVDYMTNGECWLRFFPKIPSPFK